MTFQEYIKKLNALKEGAGRDIIAKLPAIEKQAYQLLLDFLDENVDTKDGKFVANEKAVAALQNFTDVYLAALTELSDYRGSVSSYLKNFKDLSTLINEFQASQGNNFEKGRLGPTQELVVNELINRYTENGLNAGFVQPLRELLFNNITGGLNKREAIEQLRAYIEGGRDESGILGRYIEQTAQQGVDSYTGAINTKIMEGFKIDTFIMSGSLIATSSPQCRFVIEDLGGILDRKDWAKAKKIAQDNGLIKGTTFDNLPINKFHWGCRHEFTPVTLTPKQRESLLANPVNN